MSSTQWIKRTNAIGIIGSGSVSHMQAMNKATEEYRKYQQKTLRSRERLFRAIKLIESKAENK